MLILESLLTVGRLLTKFLIFGTFSFGTDEWMCHKTLAGADNCFKIMFK